MTNKYKKRNIKKDLSKTLLKFSVPSESNNEFQIKKFPSYANREEINELFNNFKELNFYRIDETTPELNNEMISSIVMCVYLSTFDFSSDSKLLLENNKILNTYLSNVVNISQKMFSNTNKANKFIKKFSKFILKQEKFNKESKWS